MQKKRHLHHHKAPSPRKTDCQLRSLLIMELPNAVVLAWGQECQENPHLSLSSKHPCLSRTARSQSATSKFPKQKQLTYVWRGLLPKCVEANGPKRVDAFYCAQDNCTTILYYSSPPQPLPTGFGSFAWRRLSQDQN